VNLFKLAVLLDSGHFRMSTKRPIDDFEDMLELRDEKISKLEMKCKRKETDIYILEEAYKICLEEAEEMEAQLKNEQEKVSQSEILIFILKNELEVIKVATKTKEKKILRRSLRTSDKQNSRKHNTSLGSEFIC